MKVLHLTTHLNTGGITSYIFRLTQGLQSEGIEVQVGSAGGEWSSEFTKRHVQLHQLPLNTKSELSPKLWICFWKLKKMAPTEKWDLIHAHTRVTECLAQLLSASLHIPYVTTIHGFHTPHFGRKLFPCLGHKTIAISHPVESFLMDHYPSYAKRITTIHHGLTDEWLDPNYVSNENRENFKKKIGLKPYPVIGNIGRLSYEKGHVHLIDVVKYLWEEKKFRVQLLIMGDGNEKSAIEKRIQELNLQEWVFLLDPQKFPQTAMSCIDIFVSYHVGPEGFGFSLLEAMAMRKPVVSRYLQGGMADILEHGKEGFLIRGGTIENFSEKVYELLIRHDLRKQFGEAAFQKVSNQFSYQKMIQSTVNAYKEVFVR